MGFLKTPGYGATYLGTFLFISQPKLSHTFCAFYYYNLIIMSTDPYLDITIDAMSTALDHNPRGFQRDVIPYIIRMKPFNTPHPIHPVLLVQGTGGGKSSVYQTIGVIKQGVSLIIENMLSLSSDQLSKIKLISERIPNVH